MDRFLISTEDRSILRDLAKKQQEYANLPIMEERKKRWFDHNDLKGRDVMLHFETWTFINDLMPKLQTSSDLAREIEWKLYENILNHECIGDDRVVSDTYNLSYQTEFVPFDLDVEVKQTDGVGYQFVHRINDIEEDFELFKPARIRIFKEETLKKRDFLQDLFGDILPVRLMNGSLGACLSFQIVKLMGMENMFMAMMDSPDHFHKIMDMLSDDFIRYFKMMEDDGLLFLNNRNDPLGQGTFGFTNELPTREIAEGDTIRTTDMWGYMDSQETEGISPDMFHEFFFPYYLKVAKQFGKLSYGCCEPVHLIWKNSASRYPNLRKISISPWCDEECMGDVLRELPIIYQRKPSPNFVGVDSVFDEDGFANHIKKTIQAAKGCKLEISFRDVYSTCGDPNRPKRAIEIVRHLIEKHWE